MLSCSVWFSAPSFWMGGGLESRCLGRVYGADGAVTRHHPHRTHDLTVTNLFNKVLNYYSSQKSEGRFLSFTVNCQNFAPISMQVSQQINMQNV
jgi:hypothetical protein